jgi:hypothetical protein
MQRRNRNNSNNNSETFTIWTSFTDLMSNAFMIITLLLVFVVSQKKPPEPPGIVCEPKIINLPSEQYSFESGSAVLPNNLKSDILQGNKPGKILKLIEETLSEQEQCNNETEVLEIIGHTDDQPVNFLKCDTPNNQTLKPLDNHLENVATGNQNINTLCPRSNTDLGLMRALSVVKELQKAQNKTRLSRFKKVQFRAYSAAQLFLPENQGFAKNNTRKDPATRSKRRRIEIRFAQLGEYVTPDEN